MKEHPLHDLMSATMEKVHGMVDANTVVGTPIHAGDVTIVPISKASFGFAAGGSDFAGKGKQPGTDNSFGGGTGAGVKVEPIAFLIIRDGGVKLLPVMPPAEGTVGRVVDIVPELVDKITDFIEKQQDKKDNAGF